MFQDIDREERPKNPREGANIFSIVFFGYTLPTYRVGCRRDLTENDIYQNLKQHGSKLLVDQLEREWERQLLKQKPSLCKAIFKVFRHGYFTYCGIFVLIEILKLSQPVSLYYLLLCYIPNQTMYSKLDSYIFASLVVGTSIIFVMVAHSYMMGLQHMGMKMRIACSSLIYRKCLKLSAKSLKETTVGQMVNLLSNDVNRFDIAIMHLPYICICPFEMIVVIILFYLFAGMVSMPGLALYIVLIPVQVILAPIFFTFRQRIALRTDERVRLMSEIISGIQVIKMYTWELYFTTMVEYVRRIELSYILKTNYVKSVIYSFSTYISRFAIFLSVLVATLTDRVPSASVVFYLVAYFNVLRQNITVILPQAISHGAEAKMSIKRVENFLLCEEKLKIEKPFDDQIAVGIVITDATANWSDTSTENTLQHINMFATQPELIAIIGAVGSGKSSLLNLILSELRLISGSVNVNGTISYAAQEPWIFNDNIRNNILFGETYDHARYNEVVEVCALKRDFSLLPFGDETLLGERGVTLSGGQRARINLARAIYKKADIYLLDDPLSAVDTYVGKHIFEEGIQAFLGGKCVILVTHQIQYLHMLPKIIMLQNRQKFFEGNYYELQTAAPTFTNIFDGYSDETTDVKKITGNEDLSKMIGSPNAPQETQSIGGVKCIVYKAYMKAGGNFCRGFLMIFLFILTQTCMVGCDYFITFWVITEQQRETENVSNENLMSRKSFIYIYASLTIAMLVITQGRSMYFFSFCMKASIGLHNVMFDHIVKAPMSFFSKNPSGRILNRFTKDMGAIDEQLPVLAIETFQIGLQVFGIMILTGITNKIVIVPMLLMFTIFYLLKLLYLRVSRNVKRLESITKSPVFTHVNSTYHGLVTIRAFKAEGTVINEFDKLQDVHSSTWHLFISLSRSFGFILDLICSSFIGFVTYSYLLFLNEQYVGNVGLSITQSLALTGMFQWGIRQWSELETQMTSVERIQEYALIKQETNTLPTIEVSPIWPQYGGIEFRHVYMKYCPQEQLILNDLNFKIEPQEKVGIIGRTGAGKSSLIGSLFQLTETSGEILIDGVNTQMIPLHLLRSKIAIIPQEPVLFAGTIRQNLDPYMEHSDAEIWNALDEVEMKSTISELPLALLSPIFEEGANFSVGQRQLFCLARAILQENKIIILDEATANVDRFTDAQIQHTIRNICKYCTVLTIAHRLETIVDYDKIVVMDNGKAVEIGHPYVLLQNTQSIFYGMVHQMGQSMVQDFLNSSASSYTHKQEDNNKEDI